MRMQSVDHNDMTTKLEDMSDKQWTVETDFNCVPVACPTKKTWSCAWRSHFPREPLIEYILGDNELGDGTINNSNSIPLLSSGTIMFKYVVLIAAMSGLIAAASSDQLCISSTGIYTVNVNLYAGELGTSKQQFIIKGVNR